MCQFAYTPVSPGDSADRLKDECSVMDQAKCKEDKDNVWQKSNLKAALRS